MAREIYLSNEVISLVEFLDEDKRGSYDNWLDLETQKGFNFKFSKTFEEYYRKEQRQRWFAAIMLNSTKQIIGNIGLSPVTSPPDLAIWLYRDFRCNGYGTIAFRLGVEYCFNTLGLDFIYAGCYQNNDISMKMLTKCGFQRHISGDANEIHFLTNEPIIQYDFILHKKSR